MKTVSKIVGAALDGVAGGLALAFILCVAVSVIAISTGSRATLPGLFTATRGAENGALALEFQPNFAGMVVVIALSVLVSVVMAVRRSTAESPDPR
ncbi:MULTISPECIES: hypothetical protein [unclassified Arthrobacter]|jgi:hypothetical protein|uniref:hypothetical protein n=1 Tax=unclassified Arthrobacter TaxID=235627 RepID=UPI0007236013|nr:MULTISPECIES: hypothetical protein [unclassified Arthrobacter]GAP57673.1 hypothetical protein AHiyo1_05730 [Arthrobacter sp. Hiyo1]